MMTHVRRRTPRFPRLPRFPGTRRRRASLLASVVVLFALVQTGTAAAVTTTPSLSGVRSASPSGSSSPQLTLPAPTGREQVGTVSLHLADGSRPDPWLPKERSRQLMVQVWYPAATVRGYPAAPLMTPATARAYEKRAHLPVLNWPTTAGHMGAPARERRGGWPVVLYSHGLGGERAEATALVQDLASRGYIVVTVDHIHDAGAVELPDGRVETSALPELTSTNELAVTTKAVNARVADIRFVLDQLEALRHGDNPDVEHRELPHGLGAGLDLRHVGIFGHSDGGTTSSAALHSDRRLSIAIALDSNLWTPESRAGSDRPLLLFGKRDLQPRQVTSWAKLWANQRGPKLQLNVAGTTHSSFLDLAVLVPQVAPLIGYTREEVVEAVGTVDGHRMVGIMRTYVGAYLDRYLSGRAEPLLDGPSAEYPEVTLTH